MSSQIKIGVWLVFAWIRDARQNKSGGIDHYHEKIRASLSRHPITTRDSTLILFNLILFYFIKFNLISRKASDHNERFDFERPQWRSLCLPSHRNRRLSCKVMMSIIMIIMTIMMTMMVTMMVTMIIIKWIIIKWIILAWT